MKTYQPIFALVVLATLFGCGGGGSTAGNPNSPTIEDTSASGAAAAAVGGALSGSTGSAGLASLKETPEIALHDLAQAPPVTRTTKSCPSTLTTSGEGCTASGDSLWLTYDDCVYGSTTYAGVLEIQSNTPLSCGTSPSPGANGSLTRQYVKATSPTTPGELITESSFGTLAIVDDGSSDLSNFNGASISTIVNGGYGALVTYGPSGGRSQITLGHHLEISTGTDLSITGTVAITETAGATSRGVSGQVTIYHNLLKVVATSTFTNVIHEDSCCVPVSGVIMTTFARGSVNPTSDGSDAVGKTETLTLTGCGTGTLQTYDGLTENVSLSRCF